MQKFLLVLRLLTAIVVVRFVNTSSVLHIGRENGEISETEQVSKTASLPLLSSSSLVVFLCPPASFVHNQIAVGLELYKRGHHVVFATLQGFQPHLQAQLKILEMDSPSIEAPPIEVLEIRAKFHFDLDGKIGNITETVRSKYFLPP